ncbi:FabD/lysophospholipase-like protein [Aaosphaeria arxii CBS 175.79]|uniref:FabD/lysophospholipase-like protein n=1 Tax=Aaosphaeria arxii CBS 175.79 TaxID=1450172 RepID=A0A6A5XZA2_9PLEO|nr:FabD/lysophospholipase-like protein [Aaosphaeria arxii CBS 175.79]KAF2018299.1 FabD/lysophospholipase-like protein [Aaosphaeria arxii CBS 175.79]
MASQKDLPPYSRPLRLLSLDGGGVRGLTELLILKTLMHRIQPQTKDRALPKPCDYFDVICGTSTGGLIAIMLGRLEMSVDECIAAYIELSKEIFPKEAIGQTSLWSKLQRFTSAYREKAWFSADRLKECLQRTIGDKLGKTETEQEFLSEDTKSILRAYESRLVPHIPCKIWEAGRATSAAPLYFEPISIGPLGSVFADGGMKNNNPVWVLYEEARNEWPDAEIACIVSIGTGKPETKQLGTGLQEVMESCVSIAAETEETARLFRSAHKALQGRYFRFNVEQGLQGIALDEWTHFDRMDAATQQYLTDIADDLGACAAILARYGAS